MKSNISGEDFNLVVWDSHSIRINAYVAKIVLTHYTDVYMHSMAGSCAHGIQCQKQ